jgi:CubicO group peptidase (beta-lactamase class C family)
MEHGRREFVQALCVGGVAMVAGSNVEAAEGVQDVWRMLAPIRAKYDLPALAAAVYHRGETVASGVTGVRKYGDPTSALIDDQFHLGSDTKSMTATLVAMLVEEHKLDWKAPLTAYFPEMRSTMAVGLRKVTLAHLACHRSGITAESWPKDLGFKELHDLTGSFRAQRQVYAEHILKEEPMAEPGAKYIYSNRNFALLGIVAERVANEEWETLITRKLFKPLGMKSAGFQAMGTPGTIDQPWQHRMDGAKRVPIGPGKYSDNPEVIGPAGTVHCAVTDWLKYASAHARGANGGSALLSAETYRYLHMPQFGGEYAFGWITTERPWGGGTVLTHGGSNNMNFAVVWVAPLRDFAVVVATNQAGGGADVACDAVAAAMIGKFLR